MQDIKWIPAAEDARIDAVSRTANAVWREHYGSILSPDQIDYMLHTFQSPEAIRRQLEEGYRYFLVEADGCTAGYFSFHPEPSRLFLSKLYVVKSFRGGGIARRVLAFLEGVCREQGLKAVYLTVNKHNAGSIAAYERMGFHKVGEQMADIGQGYVMDDYIMEKEI